MAVHFDDVDGNHNVCLAGHFNASDAGGYTPAFSGATAFSVAFTIQPDALDTASRHLVHCGAETGGSQSFFIKHRGDAGIGTLRIHIWDENFNQRNAITAAGVLVAGTPNRIMFRWRASDQVIKCQVNGTDVPVTLGGGGIAHMGNNVLANNAPLEMGAASGDDALCVAGIYQQWAMWTSYLSDAQAASYGATGDPSVLPTGIYWVTLASASITPVDTPGAGQGGAYPVGHIHDGWTGVDYAGTTTTYNYGGGDFQWPFNGEFGGTIVSDLTVIAPPVTPWYQDASLPILPQRAFEEWEHAGELGVRSGVTLLVPSVYASLQAAADAASYGDDIIIDHTSALTSASTNLHAKTTSPTTPRCPPGGRTAVTGRTPLTG